MTLMGTLIFADSCYSVPGAGGLYCYGVGSDTWRPCRL